MWNKSKGDLSSHVDILLITQQCQRPLLLATVAWPALEMGSQLYSHHPQLADLLSTFAKAAFALNKRLFVCQVSTQ